MQARFCSPQSQARGQARFDLNPCHYFSGIQGIVLIIMLSIAILQLHKHAYILLRLYIFVLYILYSQSQREIDLAHISKLNWALMSSQTSELDERPDIVTRGFSLRQIFVEFFPSQERLFIAIISAVHMLLRLCSLSALFACPRRVLQHVPGFYEYSYERNASMTCPFLIVC